MKRLVVVFAVSGLCGVSTVGFGGEPSGAAASDHEFVAKAAASGSTDHELGKVAVERAKHADLKAFADQVVRDHAAANMELLALAGRKQIPVPKAVDAKQRETIMRLSKLSGEQFDQAFATQMVKDHVESVALFRSEAENGKDPQLKSYATKILPILEEHLRLARGLTAEKGPKANSPTSR